MKDLGLSLKDIHAILADTDLSHMLEPLMAEQASGLEMRIAMVVFGLLVDACYIAPIIYGIASGV